MAKQMTKAERIYEDSKRAIRGDVRRGFFYDALNRLAYGEDETICTRTINAMQKFWEDDVRRFERDVRWEQRHPDTTETESFKSDYFAMRCEVLRRLGLTIKNARDREIAWKRHLRGEITLDEYFKVA